MSNLFQRILAGAIGIPLAVFLIWLGGWWFTIAIILITTIALWEFFRLSTSKNAAANQSVGIIWSIALQLAMAGSLYLSGREGYALLGVSILIFIAGVLVVLTTEIWRARENALINTAMTIAGVSYITLCMSTLFFLRETPDVRVVGSFGDHGATLVLILFVSVWICDTGAYFSGRWFGKNLLFPRVSPKKTWEGAIGGGIVAVAAFTALSYYFMPGLDTQHAVVCGLIVGTFGQIGDLAESLLKRDATIKDSSQIIPGHGGFLDRFDSMLFASPLVYVYLSATDLVPYLLS